MQAKTDKRVTRGLACTVWRAPAKAANATKGFNKDVGPAKGRSVYLVFWLANTSTTPARRAEVVVFVLSGRERREDEPGTFFRFVVSCNGSALTKANPNSALPGLRRHRGKCTGCDSKPSQSLTCSIAHMKGVFPAHPLYRHVLRATISMSCLSDLRQRTRSLPLRLRKRSPLAAL